MTRQKKQICMLISCIAFSCIICGCATTTFTRTNPLNVVEADDGYATLRFDTGSGVSFGENDVNIKVDGIDVTSNEILIPAGNIEHVFKFNVETSGRGFFSANDMVAQSKFSYDFKAGEVYLLQIHEAGGTQVGKFFLGAMIPAEFECSLYLNDDDEDNKLAEFDAEKLDDEEW